MSVFDTFPAFTQRFEGRLLFMYCDALGLVTTGVGNLIDPVSSALSLPWRLNGQPATQGEIRQCWSYVKSRSDMCKAGGAAYGRLAENVLRLTDADVDALVAWKCRQIWVDLLGRYPGLGDYPDDAQTAVLSMAWAMGAAFKFPKFDAAFKARDWKTCAVECWMQGTGVEPRNAANRALFGGLS